MPAVLKEQSAEAQYGVPTSRGKRRSPPPVTSAHARQGDRCAGDDEGDDDRDGNDGAQRLPVFVRYRDLLAAGIVGSWTQLERLIQEHGFPCGVMLSANIRAWRLDQVESWLDGRPTERKAVPSAWTEERRQAAEDKRGLGLRTHGVGARRPKPRPILDSAEGRDSA